MTPDPEDKSRAENLLRGLELSFLTALAEHQAEERLRVALEREQRLADQRSDHPKGEAAPSESGSGDGTTGTDSSSEAIDPDPDHVYVYVKATRENLDNYTEALAHVITHDCEAGHQFLESMIVRVIDMLVQEGHKKGWYEDGGMDAEEYQAYMEWLDNLRKDRDADNPEGEA